MQINPDKIRNILLVRNDRFGEFILNIPALRAVKEAYSKAKLILIVNPYVEELAKCLPFIDEIIPWAGEKVSLRAKKADIAIMLNPSKEFNIKTFLAGIPIRVGYNRKWGFLLNKKIEDRKYLGLEHEIEYNLELVNLIGAKTANTDLSLEVDPKIINSLLSEVAIDNSDKLVAIHPFTSDSIKQWKHEYFIETAKSIVNEFAVKVVIVGAKEGKSSLYDNLDKRIINLSGKTTLKELAALLKRCALLVSGDSGPVHLACSVATPVVVLFRNDIPGKGPIRWGPWGKNNSVIQKANLEEIRPKEVLEKVRIYINEKISHR